MTLNILQGQFFGQFCIYLWEKWIMLWIFERHFEIFWPLLDNGTREQMDLIAYFKCNKIEILKNVSYVIHILLIRNMLSQQNYPQYFLSEMMKKIMMKMSTIQIKFYLRMYKPFRLSNYSVVRHWWHRRKHSGSPSLSIIRKPSPKGLSFEPSLTIHTV